MNHKRPALSREYGTDLPEHYSRQGNWADETGGLETLKLEKQQK